MIARIDILDNIESNQHKYTEKIIRSAKEKILFSKIVSLYVKYLLKALLDGHRWNIHRFGTFTLESEEVVPNRLRFTPQYYPDDKLRRNKRMLNTKTLGKVFFVQVNSSTMDKYKAKYRPAKWFRKELSRKLFETGKIKNDDQ